MVEFLGANRDLAKSGQFGAPGRTRTCDPRLRRAVVLLRSRFVLSDLGRYPREVVEFSSCLAKTNVARYHSERNHQGLGNELIDGAPPVEGGHRIRRRPRLGGLLDCSAHVYTEDT